MLICWFILRFTDYSRFVFGQHSLGFPLRFTDCSRFVFGGAELRTFDSLRCQMQRRPWIAYFS
ncbi:MAG: hypothetical protein ACI4XF_03715 [Oscillospiraceae bacterium]